MAASEPNQTPDLVPDLIPDLEHLPETSKYQNLHDIIARQILTPETLSNYVAKIKNELGDESKYIPHDITLEEKSLFAAVYRAHFSESVKDTPNWAHLGAANFMAKALKLESAYWMDHTFGLDIKFYPVLTYPFPPNVISQFLSQIRDYIEQNKNSDSFGVLLNVGISTNTKVMCCVFGSKTPLDFKCPKELVYGDYSLPVLVTKNWISRSTALGDLPTSWLNRTTVDLPEISLSGQSVGQYGDIKKAGSFGFYVEARNKEIYAVITAHAVPSAETGSIIVSPSPAEITGRLEAIVQYTTFGRDSRPHIPGRQSEVQSILDKYQSEISKDGCEIFTKSKTGEPRSKKIILSGHEFGKVTAKSVTNRSDMMKEHNTRLENQGSPPFNFPTYQPKQENEVQSVSRLEWCCFKLSDLSRFGKNNLESVILTGGTAVKGIGLLEAGMEVVKNGRTTGETKGEVNKCILQCWPDDSQVVTTEIVVIGDKGPFGDIGDSGSLVTAIEQEPNGVGMLIATDETKMLAVVTPLWAIFEDMEEKTRLGLKFYTEK